MADETSPRHPQWPRADEAVAALREEFGAADIKHLGGGLYSIAVPVDGVGVVYVGDVDGNLGDSNEGWSAELHVQGLGDDPVLPDCELVCSLAERDVPEMVKAVRAFLDDRARTLNTDLDLTWRRDQHREATGHWVELYERGYSWCGACTQLHREYNPPDDEADA